MRPFYDLADDAIDCLFSTIGLTTLLILPLGEESLSLPKRFASDLIHHLDLERLRRGHQASDEEGVCAPFPSLGGEQTLKPRNPAEKVATWVEAERWRAGRKGRVAFTNGVFDLLHSGHIDVLTAARATADALIVGVNSDESVRRLKGPTRPVRTDAERAYVLAALECVDLVVIFPEDTPLNLVKHIKPDVIVKGGDYSEDTIVGAAEVKSWGGNVVVVPLTPGHSTTAIIRKLSEIS